jgi:hypothetical protein
MEGRVNRERERRREEGRGRGGEGETGRLGVGFEWKEDGARHGCEGGVGLIVK